MTFSKNCILACKLRCQNVSTETWIRASEFGLKIPIRYEDMNKIQAQFPQSRKFPRSGMHRGPENVFQKKKRMGPVYSGRKNTRCMSV